MHTVNVNTMDGLVNGSTGQLKEVGVSPVSGNIILLLFQFTYPAVG